MKSWKATVSVFIISVLMLVLALSVGCARQPNPQAADENYAAPKGDDRTLPFDRDSKKNGISPSGTLVPTPQNLPAGTPITIRLQSAVSSASSHSGDTFEGVVEEPIVIQGQTAVPRGANATGRVVAAKASGRLHDPGYLRLTLASISINGKDVPVQTSSIFIKGASHEKRNLEMIGGGAGAGVECGLCSSAKSPSRGREFCGAEGR